MKRQLAITEDIRQQSLLSISGYRQQLIEEFTCRFGAQAKEMNLEGSDYIYSFPLAQASAIRKELLSNGFAPKTKDEQNRAEFHYNSVLGAYLKQTSEQVKLSFFIN